MIQKDDYIGGEAGECPGGTPGPGMEPGPGDAPGRGTGQLPPDWNREALALRKRQRRQFSWVGLAAASFLLVTFLAQIAVMAFAGVLDRILGGAVDFYSGTGLMFLSAVPMYLVAFPVAAALLQLVPKCGNPQREQWGMGKFMACLVISLGIGLAGNLLGQLVEWLKPSGMGGSDLDSLLSGTGLWVNVLFTVLLAPVVEELFYRKLLMDRLLGYGEGAAVLMSGLMFGLAHGNFSQFFYAFGIGVVWAYVYAKTGKVGYTIAFHMIFNLLGGVITVELLKGVDGMLEGPWLLRQIEQALALDFSTLISIVSGILIIGYFILMASCLIGGITIIILYRRQIRFAPGQWPIRKGQRFKTVVLNVGMVLYFLICGGLFALNW